MTEESSKSDNQTKKPNLIREKSFIEPNVKQPFGHRLKLNYLDKIKIGINAIILLPIRIILFILIIAIAVLVAKITILGVSDEDLRTKPLQGWRKKGKTLIMCIGRALSFSLGFHYVKTNGKRADKSVAPIIVAAPHSTFFDIFLAFTMDIPCAVSRIENAHIPILGILVRAMQPIHVTREDSKNKSAVINEIKRRAATDSGWPQMLIFPEGTCTNRSCLITFKQGAFIPGVPVQPVCVEYKNRLDTVTWTWDGISVWSCLFYTLCQFHTYVELTYLPVYTPNDKEKEDSKLFAENVRQKIADYLNVPVTNHTFEDCRLLQEARKLKVPVDTGLVEFAKLQEKLGLTFNNAKEMLEKFIKISKQAGKIDINDFCKYLELPPSEYVTQVFKLYDRDSNGTIDFREFLIGLSLLTKPANTEERLTIAFNLFDKESKGHITLNDFQIILYTYFKVTFEDAKKLFVKIDKDTNGHISFDEFKQHALEKPEYMTVFLELEKCHITPVEDKNEKSNELTISKTADSIETNAKTVIDDHVPLPVKKDQ